jgi:hypothetical protein
MQFALYSSAPIRVFGKSIRIDVYHTFHRLAGKIHRLRRSVIVVLRPHAHNQRLTDDAATYMAVHHESQPAEHLFLIHAGTVLKNIAPAFAKPSS